MTIIEKIARALATKHYTDRFRPVAGKEEIVIQNVNANWMIFTADAAVAMEAAGEAFADWCDNRPPGAHVSTVIRMKIKEELSNG